MKTIAQLNSEIASQLASGTAITAATLRGVVSDMVASSLTSGNPNLFNVKNYGALGDGSTDDTTAINSAASAAISACNVSGAKTVLYFPAGTYVFGGGMSTFTNVPVAVVGDGSFQSIIKMKSGATGDVFSWSEVWQDGTWTNPPTYPFKGGPQLRGIMIDGEGQSVNAIQFYDRVDFAYINDVTVTNCAGWGFAAGVNTKSTIQAYMRESHISNLRIWKSGTSSVPSIELGSIGSGDRTNTCYWSGIDIFGAIGPGLVLRGSATSGLAVDTMFFDYLRIESCGNDHIRLGDSGFTARVTTNVFKNVLMFSIPSSHYGIICYNNNNLNNNYENRFYSCHLSSPTGGGINIVGARDFSYEGNLDQFTTPAAITVGPTSGGSGSNLFFDVHGGTRSTSIDTSAVSHVQFINPSNTLNEPVSVMNFANGVAIGNGSADAGPAFAAAFQAFSQAGWGDLYVPPGTYNFITSVLTPPSNVTIRGAGIDATILKVSGTFPNNVTVQIPMTLTGTPWPSGPTTYAINAPTLGASTITTTTAADAGNFSAGMIIFITGPTHGTSFWYPGWYTTVVSAVAGTGVITLAETLPIGGSALTLCQQIVTLPQNICIRDMTILGGSSGNGGAAIECQGGKNFLFENLKVTLGTGNNTQADSTFGIHKYSTFRHCIFEGGANPVELFVSYGCTIEDCHITNGYILVDGGCIDCSVVNCTVADPQNNGSSGDGISIGPSTADGTTRTRIVGNVIKGIPSGNTGINTHDTPDASRFHVIMGNTLIGAGTAVATGVTTGQGVCVGNFFQNLQNGIQLEGASTGSDPIIEGNYFDSATTNQINPFTSPALFRTRQNPTLQAMTAGTATPTVQGGQAYTLTQGGAQSVTGFTGGLTGDEITVVTRDANTTFTNGAGLQMKSGANYNAPNNTVMRFLRLTSSQWIEISRTQ